MEKYRRGLIAVAESDMESSYLVEELVSRFREVGSVL